MSQEKNFDLENVSLEKIDVIVLCGGFGKRLKSVIHDTPKVLAKIGDTTFLDILINNISLYGFKDIVLCIGHLKEQIKRHFDYHCDDYHDYHGYDRNIYNITFSEEEEPLGTGGALKNAEWLIKSDPFIVMNGDSICNVNFRGLLDFHIYKKALLSIVLTKSLTSKDYGTVLLNDSSIITNFSEKSINNKEILINAGIYIMQKDIFSYMPIQKTFSLEYDLFPKLCNNKCYGFMTGGRVIDIGTPERYKEAIHLIGGI